MQLAILSASVLSAFWGAFIGAFLRAFITVVSQMTVRNETDRVSSVIKKSVIDLFAFCDACANINWYHRRQ